MADSIYSSSDEEEILTYKLRIHDADISDSGKWQCEVKDKYGTVSTTCDLDVFEEAKRQSLVSGSDIKVVQNGTVPNGKSVNGAGSDSEEEILTYRLKIHDADIKDAGRWKCEVKDKYGTASTSCDLDVYDTTPVAEEPRFLMSLRNVSTLEGKSIKLICRVRGTPLPKIIWYKDNVPISKDDYNYQVLYLKDGTISLEIFYPKPDKDAAVFKCEAQNDKGVVTSEAKVTVLAKNRAESVSRDHLLNLSQWSRARSETRRAASESRNSTRATSESRYTSSSTLKSSSKKLEDYYINRRTSKYGNYECDDIDAKYDVYKPGYTPLKFLNTSELEPEMKLKIKWGTTEEFYFQENLKNKCILEGSRAFLSCFLIGKLPMYVQWYKDGKALPNNIYERYGIRQRSGHLSLEIPCTELEDTGDYLVDVRNEQGRTNSSCYIQIEPRFKHDIEFEKPTFVEGIHHIHVNERQTATFQVIAKGKPRPGIKWFKDGKRIQVTQKTTIHNGQKGGSILMIHICDFSDQGLYKVEAHNMAGRCSGSAKLSVFESGTRFTCGENGDIKIIRRRDSLEDEEIDTENLSGQTLSSTMEREQSSGVNRGESESSRGLDETDITLIKSKTLMSAVNGDLEIIETTSKTESVKGSAESNEQDRSESRQGPKVKSENCESMALTRSSDLKTSSTTNSSLKTSEITNHEKTSVDARESTEIKRLDLKSSTITDENKGEFQNKDVSRSLNESESIASADISKIESARSVVQKSTTETESNESVTVDIKQDKVQNQNESETKTVAKEGDSLDGQSVTGDLQRTASFEAIEKARRLSKGDVKLEKLYSPNADGSLLSSKFNKSNGKLSRGSSIDESEKPRRKLSKGASVEDSVNGLASRRLSKGSPVEDSVNGLASRRSSKGFQVEETGNGKIHRKLSKGLSVEDTGNGSRKGSLETKVTQKSSESMESSKVTQRSSENMDSSKVTQSSFESMESSKVTQNSSESKESSNVTQNSSESMESSKVTCETDQILPKKDNQTISSATSLTDDSESQGTKLESDESKDETLTLKQETVVKEIVPEKASKTVEIESDSKQTSTEITTSEDKATDQIRSADSKNSQEVVTSIDADIVKTQTIANNESAGDEGLADKAEVKSSSEKLEDRISTKEKEDNTDNTDFIREQIKEAEASLIVDMKTDAHTSPVLAVETTSDIKSNTDDAKTEQSLEEETKSYNLGAQSSIEESKVSEVLVESSQDKCSSDKVDAAVSMVTSESLAVKSSSQTSKSTEKTTESSEGKQLVETANSEVSENKSLMITAQTNVEETEEMNSIEASSVKVLKSEKEMSNDSLTKNTDSVASIEQLETSSGKVKSATQTSIEDKSRTTKGQEIEEKSLLRSDKMFAGGEDAEITTEEESSKIEEKETIYTTPPNIVKFLPKVVELKDGETLKFQCLVSGEPRPKVVWLHNKQRITSSSDHIILTSKEQYHNLEITKTKFLRDAGIYTLKATNISGEQLSHCEVQIEGTLKISTEVVDSKEKLSVNSASEEISAIKEKSIDVEDKKNLQSNLKNVDEQKDFKSDVSEKTDFNTKSLNSEELITSSLSADKKKDSEVEVDRALKKDLDISMVEDKKASALDAKNVSEKTSSNVNNESQSSRTSSTKMTGDREVIEMERMELVQTETCMTNAPSSKREEQHVELTGKPYFAVPLQEEYCPMERDENVRLYVKVGGEPYSPARWFKDGEELESSRRVMVNWDTVTQESTVVISRYKLKDAGVYECLILSETGAITTRTLLNLKRLETQRVETKLPHETPDMDVPLILWPIKDTTVYKGQEAYFECGVDKQPNVEVKWYKDQREIRLKKRKYNFTETKGVHTLTVEDVQEADLGSYTCEVYGTDRTVSVSANILLKAEKNKSIEIGPPKLTVQPDSLMGIAAGETAVFKCSAEANPPPLFRWTKDMVDITQSPRVKVSMSDSGQSTLTISNAMYSDRGMYVCIVKNRLGRVKTRTSLHIGDEYKERDVSKSVRRESTNTDISVEDTDIITKKTTLDLLSEKLDEVDIVKSKIVLESKGNHKFTSEDGVDGVETHSKIVGEFEVDLGEEAKAKLAEEVAKTDRIEAEKFILLAVMEAEKANKIAEEKVKLAKEKAKLVTEVAAEDRNEAKKAALIAAEEAEKARMEANEKIRIAAEVAKKDKIIAERVALLMEKERIIAEESQQARILAVEAEKAKIAAEEAETDRIAAEKAEKARMAAEKAETDRIAAEEAEKARIAAEKAETDRIAVETEKQEETPKPKKKHRMTFEEAETLRLEAEVEDGIDNSENVSSEKDSNGVTKQVEEARIAAKAEKGRIATIKSEESEEARIAAEEAEKARFAAEKAEKARIAAEEAEIARIAAEEAEKARIAAEEADKARIAAEEAEKARIAAEEADKARIAAEEAEKARIAAEKAEEARISAEEAEKTRIAAEQEVTARIAAEEAEKARIAAEKAEKARIAAEEADKARIAAEEAEKARIAAEKAEEARISAEKAEKTRIAAEQEVTARIADEEAEKARIAAKEAETARIAAKEAEKDSIAAETEKDGETTKLKKKKHRMTFEEAEKLRLEAEVEDGHGNAENISSEKDIIEVTEHVEEARIALEAEKVRIALEEAETAKIAAEDAENAEIAAVESEKARIAAEEAEKARIAAEEAKKARTAAEKAEKARIAAEESEKARIAAEEAEKVRITAENAETNQLAADTEKQEETPKLKKKKNRMTFEEAEKLRLEAEVEDDYGNAEQVEGDRIAAKAEKDRIALEEAETAKRALEEANKARIAAEDAEISGMATEEIKKAKIAVEEEEKARIATVAEKKQIAVEAQENEKDSRVTLEADEMASITRNKKIHRMTFEEAEKLRLISETEETKIQSNNLELSMNKNNIPDSTTTVSTSIEKSKSSSSSLQSMNISTEETFQLQRQTAASITSESIEEVDGAGFSKMSAKSVQKLESSQANVLETAGKGQTCELKQSSVSPIDSAQQEVANQIRHQLQKQLSVGGSSCEILEVSTRRVTKSTAEANTVEHSVSHHHIHHPPEIIVSPDSKRVPIHSELEITVRAKASKHARVRWVHDGETVTFKDQPTSRKKIDGRHYELITEEEPIKE